MLIIIIFNYLSLYGYILNHYFKTLFFITKGSFQLGDHFPNLKIMVLFLSVTRLSWRR